MDRQDELSCLIDRYATEDGVSPTEIPRLFLVRASRPTEPIHTLYGPALCVVAQGKKQVLLGEEVYPYNRDQHLVVSVDLPMIGQIVEACPETPYLSFQLDLDAAMLGELLTQAGLDGATGPHAGPGLTLSPADPALLDAAVRLLRLLETPRDIGILAPLFERELLYRLLTGDQARTARQIALADGRLRQVNRAIGWIKEHYRSAWRPWPRRPG